MIFFHIIAEQYVISSYILIGSFYSNFVYGNNQTGDVHLKSFNSRHHRQFRCALTWCSPGVDSTTLLYAVQKPKRRLWNFVFNFFFFPTESLFLQKLLKGNFIFILSCISTFYKKFIYLSKLTSLVVVIFNSLCFLAAMYPRDHVLVSQEEITPVSHRSIRITIASPDGKEKFLFIFRYVSKWF